MSSVKGPSRASGMQHRRRASAAACTSSWNADVRTRVASSCASEARHATARPTPNSRCSLRLQPQHDLPLVVRLHVVVPPAPEALDVEIDLVQLPQRALRLQVHHPPVPIPALGPRPHRPGPRLQQPAGPTDQGGEERPRVLRVHHGQRVEQRAGLEEREPREDAVPRDALPAGGPEDGRRLVPQVGCGKKKESSVRSVGRRSLSQSPSLEEETPPSPSPPPLPSLFMYLCPTTRWPAGAGPAPPPAASPPPPAPPRPRPPGGSAGWRRRTAPWRAPAP